MPHLHPPLATPHQELFEYGHEGFAEGQVGQTALMKAARTGTGRARKRTTVSILVTRTLSELKSLGTAPARRRRATSLRKDETATGTCAQGSFYFVRGFFFPLRLWPGEVRLQTRVALASSRKQRTYYARIAQCFVTTTYHTTRQGALTSQIHRAARHQSSP